MFLANETLTFAFWIALPFNRSTEDCFTYGLPADWSCYPYLQGKWRRLDFCCKPSRRLNQRDDGEKQIIDVNGSWRDLDNRVPENIPVRAQSVQLDLFMRTIWKNPRLTWINIQQAVCLYKLSCTDFPRQERTLTNRAAIWPSSGCCVPVFGRVAKPKPRCLSRAGFSVSCKTSLPPARATPRSVLLGNGAIVGCVILDRGSRLVQATNAFLPSSYHLDVSTA